MGEVCELLRVTIYWVHTEKEYLSCLVAKHLYLNINVDIKLDISFELASSWKKELSYSWATCYSVMKSENELIFEQPHLMYEHSFWSALFVKTWKDKSRWSGI